MSRFASMLCLILLLSLPGCGDDPVTGPTGPDDDSPTTSTLSGRILGRPTQQPVSGATVRIGEATTTSDGDGRFTFTDLPVGTATARISAAGFEDFEQSVTLPVNYILSFTMARKELLEFGDFALYVPASLPEVRGVLLALGGPDTRAFASAGPFGAPIPEVEASLQSLGARFRELAADKGLAILGTSLSALPNEAASDALLAGALAEAAVVSSRPEIEGAVLLLYGMSGGAPEASGFAARYPGRTIGLFLKVPAGIETPAGPAALGVPAFVTLAEEDAFVDNAALVDQFAGIRSAGALWALATERAVPHHSLSVRHRELTWRWMADIVDARFGTRPGVLVAIDESSGYLGDPVSGEVEWWDWFQGDRQSASWLPTSETAGRWDDLGRAAGPTSASFRTSPLALSVREGWSGYLYVSVRDATGALVWDPFVTFSSDRPDVASVTVDGCDWYCNGMSTYVMGVSEGTAMITARYGEDIGTVPVTVLPGVTLVVEPAEATIPVGGSVELTVRVVETGSGAVVDQPEFAIDGWACLECWEGSPYVQMESTAVDEFGAHFRVTGMAQGVETIAFYPRGISGVDWEIATITVE